MKYIEVVSRLDQRGNIIPLDKLPDYIKWAQSNEMELYRSLFTYNEQILQYIEETKSVAKYNGFIELDSIIIDIDAEDTAQHTLDKVRTVIDYCIKDLGIKDNAIQPFFSGTGYHVEIPYIFSDRPGSNLARNIKFKMASLFPQADHIYDTSRLIRVSNTLNSKSGLYKVPLGIDEIKNCTVEEILCEAEKPRNEFKVIDVSKIVYKLKKEPDLLAPVLTHSEPTEHTQVVTCMQKLYARGAVEGRRHRDLLALASTWRRQGVPKEAIGDALVGWAKGMPIAEIQKILDSTFKVGYRYSCDHPSLMEFCDPRCVFFKKKDFGHSIADAQSMEQQFKDYLSSDFTNKSINLEQVYPGIEPHAVYPGEYVLLIGDTGLGKTALMQYICIPSKLPILYLSLEVHQNLIYRRFLQIANKLTKKEVYEIFRQGNSQSLAKSIEHIRVVTVPPDIQNIRKLIVSTQAQVIVVDTTDCIEVQGVYDPNHKSEVIGRELKTIAQQMDVIIIGIHHISKGAAVMASMTGKLNVHSGKGASTHEQKADQVWSLEGQIQTTDRLFECKKARDEGGFSIPLFYDVQTMRMEKK